MPTFALNFSRPGGQIVAQYYNFVKLGFEGYKKIHDLSYSISKYIAKELESLDMFDIIHDGENGIPAVSWSLKDGYDFDLFDVSEKIRSRGWQIAAYSMPKNRQELVVMRVLIRNGFTFDLAQLLLQDLGNVLTSLDK